MLLPLALLLFAPSCAQDPGAGAGEGYDPVALQAKVDEILPRVAELRGWEFKRPVPAGVKTPKEFIEFAKQEFESEYGAEQLEYMNQEYRLLGLMDPELDLYEAMLELLESQVGGFYDPKTEAFYMISTFNEGMLADIIMAHELTHALDDQYYELDKMFEDARDLNTDSEFAMRAVVEGSGTSLMNLYTIQGTMNQWFTMDADSVEQMQEMMEASTEGLENAPPFLVMTLALPYLEGNKFLVRNSSTMAAAMKTPTAEELDRAFRNPPVSSEQVLHFEKYWDEKLRDDPVKVELPDLAAKLGGGWKLADEDTYGELACFVVSADELPNLADASAQMNAVWTNEAATGWGGDTLQLYQGPDGAYAAVWATVWDSVDDAGEFSAAIHGKQDQNPFLRTILDGEKAVVMIYANEKAAGLAGQLKGMVKEAAAELLK